MKIEMCDEFFYRVKDLNCDLYKTLNTSSENVVRNNDKIKMYAGEWIKVKVNEFTIHHVRPTESLADIAKLYCTTVEKIIKDNQLKITKLFIGQRIKIYEKKD